MVSLMVCSDRSLPSAISDDDAEVSSKSTNQQAMNKAFVSILNGLISLASPNRLS